MIETKDPELRAMFPKASLGASGSRGWKPPN